jgi:plastocyanin
MRRMTRVFVALAASVFFASAFLIRDVAAQSSDGNVHGQVNIAHHSKRESGSADAVVWLTPIPSMGNPPLTTGTRLVQKGKRFSPHVVAIAVGSEIEFPNQDPFFHDVFSIYRGKPFDLGLYESGSSRKVRFSQPGVSYIFCSIHPEMSAAVVALPTPYFAVTTRDGSFVISHIPAGRYKLEAWYELATEAELTSISREVEIRSGDNALPAIALHSSDVPVEHLDKYGQPYQKEKEKSY